jgi:hypothetical protein
MEVDGMLARGDRFWKLDWSKLGGVARGIVDADIVEGGANCVIRLPAPVLTTDSSVPALTELSSSVGARYRSSSIVGLDLIRSLRLSMSLSKDSIRLEQGQLGRASSFTNEMKAYLACSSFSGSSNTQVFFRLEHLKSMRLAGLTGNCWVKIYLEQGLDPSHRTFD